LEAPGGDQHLHVHPQTAEQRGDREHAETEAEHPPSPIEIADSAAEQQQAAEGEDVCIDDPRQRRRGDSQIALDAGQGDVRDGVVQDEHQLRRSDNNQRGAEPTALSERPGPARIRGNRGCHM
jgi:hypothetical protein